MIIFSELSLNEAMKEKLGKLEIDFAFQPIVKRQSMQVVGHEALMRPVGSNPLQLIKEYRDKDELHTLELATFFGACKRYYERGLTGIVSINSFPSDCLDKEESEIFFQCFPDIADKMFVEILEYTELNVEKWNLKRKQIHANGIRISLDDYGTGNNDMEAIDVFQPHEVKIDRSIISGIHRDEEKQNQLLNLIKTFHGRNIHVLAEGIECKEELDFILTTDVDYLQGYYLGMPE